MDTLTIIVIIAAAIILVGAILVMRYIEGPADGAAEAPDKKAKR